MDVINNINKAGTTVVMATHDKDIVNKMKKRVINLTTGVVTKDMMKGGYINETNKNNR